MFFTQNISPSTCCPFPSLPKSGNGQSTVLVYSLVWLLGHCWIRLWFIKAAVTGLLWEWCFENSIRYLNRKMSWAVPKVICPQWQSGLYYKSECFAFLFTYEIKVRKNCNCLCCIAEIVFRKATPVRPSGLNPQQHRNLLINCYVLLETWGCFRWLQVTLEFEATNAWMSSNIPGFPVLNMLHCYVDM